MKNRWVIPILLLVLFFSFLSFERPLTVNANFPNQLGTVAIATVTGTPAGAMIKVKMDVDQTQINVRSGPGPFYPKIGVLLVGQQAPAKGKSSGGDWILIEYPGVLGGTGWVYAPLVSITPGAELPIIEPPPTPTALYTATIDPTLAAQFIVTNEPSRLPTFTQPAPLVIPTFAKSSNTGLITSIPMGLVIVTLAAIGILIGLISLTQGR